MLDRVPEKDIKKFQSLKGVIEDLQRTMEQYDAYLSENETRTRQFLIDPLLGELDWDVLNPADVQLEYGVKSGNGTKRLDYMLMLADCPIAVVQAKRLNDKQSLAWEAKRTKNILNYPIQEDIRYIIVTDGNRWLMYEAFEVRLIMSFELYNESSDASALQALQIWRWKSNLDSGSPMEIITPVPESPEKEVEEAPAVLPALPLKPSKDGDLSPKERLYLDYWTKFMKYLQDTNSVMKRKDPTPRDWRIAWVSFGLGVTGCDMRPTLNQSAGWTSIQIVIRGENRKAYYHLLEQDRLEIENEIGAKLKWSETSKQCHIRLYYDANPKDRHDWDGQHHKLCEQLEAFYSVFAQRLEDLNVNDYQP